MVKEYDEEKINNGILNFKDKLKIREKPHYAWIYLPVTAVKELGLEKDDELDITIEKK